MKIEQTLILLLLIFIGCDKFLTKQNELYDDDLIVAIMESEQEDIAMEEMPALSRSTIEQNYTDFVKIDAAMAANLGYQVFMDWKDYKPGDHNEIFFNLEGRKLISKKDKHHRGGFRCFELVLPVTFLMPNGSSILIETESDYKNIKDWYEDNPSINEKPSLQFPVNVIYKDGVTEIIENDEGMKEIRNSCSEWHDDKKDWDCFLMLYPITFITDDGTVISMVDSEDWSELKVWHEEHQNSESPTLQYPVVITYSDGTTVTINNDDKMRDAKENCSY